MITNVTTREQGYYLCSAKNGFGPDATKLIEITVHGQYNDGAFFSASSNQFLPIANATTIVTATAHDLNTEPAKFSAKYKTVEVRIDERANMVCIANGEQPLTIDWLDKEGNLIQKNDKKYM